MDKLLSFVIPCYGSENTVEAVIDEIEKKVSERTEYCLEIIAVNDCSPDHVLSVLKKIAANDPKVKIVSLAKNVGKHGALMAGFSKAAGNEIICVDDDFQCPIDHLWELLKPIQDGYDVSIAKYGVKKQSGLKNFGSRVNNFMADILLEKPKDLRFGSFFAIKRYVMEEIVKYNKPYPYIDGLLLRTTSKIANIPMSDRERLSGKTGYTFRKSLALWMNGFTAFSVKPLRIATVTGLICAFIGFVFGIYTIIHKITNPTIQAGWSSLMATLLFIGGLIMLVLGMIGEYIGRIYICINKSPQYVIRETVNVDNDKSKRNEKE